MEKKVTKKQVFTAIITAVAGMDKVGDLDKDVVVATLETAIAQIDAKATKAKEKAAEKKVAGDELRDVIASLLTSELQTADDIVAQIEGDDVTKSKVVARLSQLVSTGAAAKEQIKAADGRKLMAYKLA
jgi:hypothetical protein